MENGLLALHCQHCGGHWIKAFQYWKWLKQHGDILPEKEKSALSLIPVEDSVKAKICIECGHLLTRHKVGHGLDFYLDRCSSCGGFWFDKNEWEALKTKNLHDEIHMIFSSAWQKDIKQQELKNKYDHLITDLIGEKDYQEAQKIKTWLTKHPKKDIILSFLSN